MQSYNSVLVNCAPKIEIFDLNKFPVPVIRIPLLCSFTKGERSAELEIAYGKFHKYYGPYSAYEHNLHSKSHHTST